MTLHAFQKMSCTYIKLKDVHKIVIFRLFTNIYTNFECLLFKSQIYINNSRRHFFIKSVIFRISRIFNGLLQTKSVKKYILTE